jgi:hypothetical protein
MVPNADPQLQAQNRRSAIFLWSGVVLGFLLLAAAWFFLVRAAREAQVETVPLTTKGGRP